MYKSKGYIFKDNKIHLALLLTNQSVENTGVEFVKGANERD